MLTVEDRQSMSYPAVFILPANHRVAKTLMKDRSIRWFTVPANKHERMTVTPESHCVVGIDYSDVVSIRRTSLERVSEVEWAHSIDAPTVARFMDQYGPTNDEVAIFELQDGWGNFPLRYGPGEHIDRTA